MTLTLVITPEGKARTINPYGEVIPPVSGAYGTVPYLQSLQNRAFWQEAESRRKTFEVSDYNTIRYGNRLMLCTNVPNQRINMPTGSIVEATETSPGIVKVISIIE